MVLVLTDHFTRWKDAIAVPDGASETVARVLDSQIFAYFGLPERIHTDQGAQFESALFQELCALWGVQKSRTTAYHPQGNGVVERGNKELGDSLRALLLNRAEEDWDLLLPQIMRSIRATPHSTTHETANYMMFGRELKLPGTLTQPSLEEFSSRTEFVSQVQQRLQDAHEYLRHQQGLIRTSDEQQAPRFQVGDLVWLQNKRFKKGTTPKLQPKFTGPYTVEAAMENHTYKISSRGKTSVENESRLKLYSPTTSEWGQAPKRIEPTRQPPRPGPKKSSPSAVNTEPLLMPSPENLEVIPRESSPTPATNQQPPEPTTALDLNDDHDDVNPEPPPAPDIITETTSTRPQRQRKAREFPGYVLYHVQTKSKTNQCLIKTAPQDEPVIPARVHSSSMLEINPAADELDDLQQLEWKLPPAKLSVIY